MKQSHFTQKDLQSVLRLKAKTNRIEKVAVARLESSGEISLRSQSSSPEIVEFEVQPGVQRYVLRLADFLGEKVFLVQSVIPNLMRKVIK